MMISKNIDTKLSAKLYQITSRNFAVTDIFHAQLSPQFPVRALLSHVR